MRKTNMSTHNRRLPISDNLLELHRRYFVRLNYERKREPVSLLSRQKTDEGRTCDDEGVCVGLREWRSLDSGLLCRCMLKVRSHRCSGVKRGQGETEDGTGTRELGVKFVKATPALIRAQQGRHCPHG